MSVYVRVCARACIYLQEKQLSARQKKCRLKFEDNSDQIHREKIAERLFNFDPSLLLQVLSSFSDSLFPPT